jgi:hypothetical protein
MSRKSKQKFWKYKQNKTRNPNKKRIEIFVWISNLPFEILIEKIQCCQIHDFIFHVNSRNFTLFHEIFLFLPVWTAKNAKTSLSWAFSQRTLPHKHVNLAPYVALVITKIFFQIKKHQPLSFENKY